MRCHWTSSLERRRGARSWDRSSKKKKKNEIFSSSNGFLIFLRFSFVRLTFFYPQWEVRNDMSISSVPFGFVLFFSRPCRFNIFIRQSRTAHATYKQVGCVSSFFFCENTQLFGFCFQCRHATRGGFVKSRRAHHQQPEEERKNSVVFCRLSSF
jgi:hypothetical protein